MSATSGRPARFLPPAALLAATVAFACAPSAKAAAIDVNQTFDYTSTTLGAGNANWSVLVWTPTGTPNGAGTTVGFDLNALARTLTMDQDVTLKQMQFYNADATVLTGGTITWDSGAAGVQCELGRNRGPMSNYSAGRNFTVSPNFILNSDLRVTNWVENRTTTYNSTTSGTGKLTIRIVAWLASNNACAMAIGGASPNTHEGGTTLTINQGTMTGSTNKSGAFGTGVLTLNGSGIVNLNLNNFSQTAAGLASGGTGAHVLRNSGASLVDLTLNLNDGATTTYAKQITGGNLQLIVDKAAGASGTGIQVLSGTNTFTGATNVNGGTLKIAGAAALQGSPAVTVAADAGFHYAATTDAPLALPGTLSLTGGTTTTLGTVLGSTTTSAAITAAGLASASAGTIVVDIAGIPGVSPTPGTYTLVSGAAGSTLDGATYVLGTVTVWNATNFTVGTPAATATEVTVPLTAAAPLTTAYWKGGFTGYANVWAVSNGSSAGNWTTNAGGTAATSLVPASTTDVVVSASDASNQGAMVLGASMNIKSLTVSDSAAVSLNADGSTLTITPDVPTNGMNIGSGAGATTIATPVALGASQTWTNDSTNPLTVSGAVGGNFGLTKAGDGVLTLGAASSYSGTTTVAEGTLALAGSGSVALSSSIMINLGAILDVSAATPSPYSLGSTQTLAGNGTVTGNIVAPGGSVVSPGASVGTLTVTGDLTFASGSSLATEIDAVTPANDVLAVSGALDVTGATLNLTVTGTPTAPAYVIATYGTLTQPFAAVTGLPPGYEIDYGYNSGTAIAVKESTGDATAPAWVSGWPTADSVTSTTFTARAETDENGTAYYVVVANDATAPTSVQVKAGNDSTNSPALKSGNIALTASTEATSPVTGLTPGTAYDVWFVAEDAVPNLQTSPVKVDVATLTTFAEWIAGFSVGGLTGPSDDPDGDGAPNILEFALNSSPASGSARGKVFVKMATVSATPNVLTLTAAVRSGAAFAAEGNSQKAVVTNDALTYLIEASNTLADWGTPLVTEVTDPGELTTIQTGLPAPDPGWSYRTFRTDGDPTTDPGDFIRVKVSSP